MKRRRINRTSNGQIFGRVMTVVLVGMLVAIVIGGYSIYRALKGRMSAAQHVEYITEDVWQLTYQGDYYFNQFLVQGGCKTDTQVGAFLAPYLGKKSRNIGGEPLLLRTRGFGAEMQGAALLGCSALLDSAEDEPARLLLVRMRPDSGYSSISTVSLDYLRLGPFYNPMHGFFDKMLVLTSLYFPSDGMNDQGFAVMDLAEDSLAVDYDTRRPDLTTFSAIRLLLDRCSRVAEAEMLLRRFDVHPSGGVAHRLLLRDAEGEMALLRWNRYGQLVEESDEAEVKRLYETNGLRELMKEQSRKGEQWSVQYDLQRGEATWWFRGQYDRKYTLSIMN